MNKERFDYARVMVSLSSLDVVNFLEHILVDGVLVEIKIVEEWGFNLGEDVCLYDEDEQLVTSTPDNVEFHDDFDLDKNVEILADNIIKDLVENNGSMDVVDGRFVRNSLETTTCLDVHATSAHSNSRRTVLRNNFIRLTRCHLERV